MAPQLAGHGATMLLRQTHRFWLVVFWSAAAVLSTLSNPNQAFCKEGSGWYRYPSTDHPGGALYGRRLCGWSGSEDVCSNVRGPSCSTDSRGTRMFFRESLKKQLAWHLVGDLRKATSLLGSQVSLLL